LHPKFSAQYISSFLPFLSEHSFYNIVFLVVLRAAVTITNGVIPKKKHKTPYLLASLFPVVYALRTVNASYNLTHIV
jgi:hypothetical protein